MTKSTLSPALVPLLLLMGVWDAAASQPTTSSSVQAQVRAYRVAHESAILENFRRLLELPNVASDHVNIQRNATHLLDLLRSRGFTAQRLESPGSPPAIFGQLGDNSDAITLMIYAHYDGQPVEVDRWHSDPWTPMMRDAPVELGGQEVPWEAPFNPETRIFARSAGDDKAPIIALIHALDALRASGHRPSVNIKLFLEGEEEAGSPHLQAMLAQHAAILAADLWLFCDGPVHQTRRPQLAFGVRGTMGFDLTVFGPSRPLHSGHYGNWAPNPIADLSRLLASMRDAQGRATIAGFYADMTAPTASELAAIEAIPRVDQTLAAELFLGRTEGGGERLERRLLQPALNFRGIQAGGIGAQARNIILPSATASIGIRLVPGQSLAGMRQVVEDHIRSQGYFVVHQAPEPSIRAKHASIAQVAWNGQGYPALRTPMTHPIASAIADILDQASDGKLVRLPTMGGSLPLYLIRQELRAPVVILPIANHDNNQHGRDENLRLQNLWDAIEIYALVLTGLTNNLRQPL